MSIHDRDEWERIGVEIRIWVSGPSVLREAQTLEVAAVFFLEVTPTVGPGLNDYLKPGWKVKFSESFFEKG
jgi:hypothetical protein